MAKFAKGKYALAISDRSGQAFPWRQMVTEWNGAFVHTSEYERKQPQLEPKPFVADPQGLEQARPQNFPPSQIGGGNMVALAEDKKSQKKIHDAITEAGYRAYQTSFGEE